jgi:hypothetical protein
MEDEPRRNAGSRVATAEGRIYVEATGKLIAHGTTTCMVLSPSQNGSAREAVGEKVLPGP